MDEARKWTDKKLKEMEKKISDIYSEAESDITKKWNAYMQRGEERLSELRESAETEAKMNKLVPGLNETKHQKAYEDALKNYTLKNDQYKELLDETTLRIANVNEIALAYSNNQIPQIYSKNYSQVGQDLKELKINFTGKSGEGVRQLVDEHTVAKLIKDGDIKLPKPKSLNVAKDQKWNTKQLNSSVLQGIIQGEPLSKIADRIMPIVNNNEKAAIRTARTLATGAENAGRKDSYVRLEKEGLVLKKVWIATPDEHTRESHLDLDGQEVDVDEPFIALNHDGTLAEIDYPGDPNADPEQVYNCRCSMKTHVVGFMRDDGSISEVDYEDEEESLHEKQIREEWNNRMSFVVL